MNIFIMASILAFSACILLAFFVYSKNRESNVNKSFAVLTFLIGIWCLFPFVSSLPITDAKSLFYARFVYIAAIFVPPTFLHFVFALLGISSFKKERMELIIFYLISCVFLIFCFSPSFIKGLTRFAPHFSVVPGKIYYAFILFFAIMAVLGHYKFFIKYKKTTGYKRNQLLYIFFAFFVASIAGLMHFLAACGIKEIFPHDFLVILFTTVISYAILRHRLMDIHIIIKKTMVYSLSTGLLTALFVILALTMTEFLSKLTGVYALKFTVIPALIIVLLFNPLRNRIQTLVDKIFYKKTYDYYTTVQKVSHELASTFDLGKIYSFVGDTILSTLGLKNIYLLSTVSGGSYRMVYSRSYKKDKAKKDEEVMTPAKKDATPELSKDSEVVKLLENSNDIVIREELPHISKISQETVDNVNKDLESFKGEVVVPVFIDDKLELLLILGGKLSGDMFSDEDIRLLNTISNQAAIAIKNARLYQEKLHSERLVSVGMTAAILAHEIKNPLSSMKIFTQLLPERYDDREFREAFTRIIPGEVERIDGLVTELLDFSRPVPLKIKSISTSALLDDILEVFKGKFEENGIRIIRDYRNNNDIAGDPKRLQQALMNIIMNSYHAMDYNGVLKVSTNTEGGYADILIEDNGNGIMPEDIDRIFDPFFTTKHNGSGLGLSISKKIIQDHKGQIRVTSRPSKGTTFVITLPLYRGNWNGAFSAS